jgi:ribonuclease HI
LVTITILSRRLFSTAIASMARQKYYAVRCGRRCGIFYKWEDCKEQVIGFSGAQYKSFKTREEANAYLQQQSTSSTSVKHPTVTSTSQKHRRDEEEDLVSLPSSRQSVATQFKRTRMTQPYEDRVVVYTDGSSLGNGQDGAQAGVGVFFGENDPRNVSEPLKGPIQTNQRAEITAVIRALERVDGNTPLEIRTDSQYVIKAATIWMPEWKRKGWSKANGGAIANEDLFRRLDALLSKRPVPPKFTFVRGHAGVPGNEAADKLAVRGSKGHNV